MRTSPVTGALVLAALTTLLGACGASPVSPPADKASGASNPSDTSSPGTARWRVGDTSLAGVELVTLSPGGRFVAKAAGERAVEILDARTRRALRSLAAPDKAEEIEGINPFDFAPGDRLIAVAWSMPEYDTTVTVHDVETGALVHSIGARGYRKLGFSPDGSALYVQMVRYAAIGSGGEDSFTTLVVDLTTGQSKSVRTSPGAVAISPKGEKLASCRHGEALKDRTLSVKDVASGRVITSWELPPYGASALAFSPDGRRIGGAGYYSGKVYVWDVETASLVFERQPRRYQNDLVMFDRDGGVWSAGERGEVTGWDPHGAALPVLPPPSGLDPFRVAIAADVAAALSRDGDLVFWDRRTQKVSEPIRARADRLVFSPDGKVLYGCVTKSAACVAWDTKAGHLTDILFPPEGPSPWLVRGLDIDKHAAWRAAFHAALAKNKDVPWDRVLPVGGGRSFLITDGEKVEITGSADQPARPFDFGFPYHVAISADGKWISARGSSGPHGLYDTATLTRRRDLAPGGNAYYYSRWSPTGDTVMLWSSEGLTLGFASASREDPGRVYTAGEMILDVDFSPDGERVAVAVADGSVRLVDVATASETMRLEHPHLTDRPYVRAVAFSPDGGSLASANDEGTLILWNVERPSR